MKALSWKQPFAELMLYGKIETRTWQTNAGGEILICSSLKPYSADEALEIMGIEQFKRYNYFLFDAPGIPLNGFAIAVGILVGCRKMTQDDEDKTFVKYRPDLYCHIYKNVTAIKPFPWKGSQGWKEVSREIIDQIQYL